MSEEELIVLCKEPTGPKKLFWVSEVYGFGKMIRRFGWYPRFLPLNIYFAHGVTMHEEPAAHELNNKAPVMLYFSPRLVDRFKKVSSKPCYCILSPNVFYRRLNNIVQSRDSKGTLAFLAHTTPMIEDRMNMSRYANQLRALPEHYQPVTICLHYHDIAKGVHKIFEEKGLEVITIGNPFHSHFIFRFYDAVRKFKFTTSNDIGSYTFYSAEMGVPFFLYGDEPEYFNLGDLNIEKGVYTSYKQTTHYQKTKELFLLRADSVTGEQTRFVQTELGVHGSISRMKLSFILYKTFAIYAYEYILKKMTRVVKVFEKKGSKE